MVLERGTNLILDSMHPGVRRRLRFLAHWRCAEPVIAFESDDWGLERRACGDFLRGFGEPGEWADEETETPEDLERLYGVLSRHRDSAGRSACFTANFVLSNPDFEKIEQDGFSRFHELPIYGNERLVEAWQAGIQQRVFYPQYHSRYHFWVEAWLDDLRRSEPGARELCSKKCHGGLSLLKGQGWRYHSEYLYWKTGEQLDGERLRTQLQSSFDMFRRTFGFFPFSTVPAHYIFTPSVSRQWVAFGVKYVQGSGYRILRGMNGDEILASHVLGERSPEGLVFLTRPVKFDPRPQRPRHGVPEALEYIKTCFDRHIPAVIDTHRINFTGRWRDSSLDSLDDLLRHVRPYRPLFLTTVEVGEAISQGGLFHDVWTGQPRTLSPLDPAWRKLLRARFSGYNRLLETRSYGLTEGSTP